MIKSSIIFIFVYCFLLNTSQSQSIELVEPNGGETFYIYSDYQLIKWHATDVTHVDIAYSTNNGADWIGIINYYPSLQIYWNEYAWNVPNTPSDSCLIKLTASNNILVSHQSDSLFSIIMYQDYSYISINEVLMWVSNNGKGAHDPGTDGSGFYWPGGVNATQTSVFSDGLVYGGYLNGELRVTGNHMRGRLTPGIILPNGVPGDPFDVQHKIYKSRVDWEYLPSGLERERYYFDFFNWPVETGAPWIDENGDGIYSPPVDHPDYIGDEILYYTANDFDSTASAQTFFGALPVGLEFHTLIYAFDQGDELQNAVFKKYTIINKSGYQIDSLYFAYFTDDDLGDGRDDYTGCDTSLNLGYTYNSSNYDDIYGFNPPAIGHMLLQGPIVPGEPQDSAFNGTQWIPGYRNLMVTSFFPSLEWFIFWDPGDAEGAYNNIRGIGRLGNLMINPHTGLVTKYGLSGDPVNETGWYEGNGWPGGPAANDRRFFLSSGPLMMNPGDTQVVVYAIFEARGNNNINSIEVLKQNAEYIRSFYYGDTLTNVFDNSVELISDFKLYQNYPNPFNPTTTIKYSIPYQENSQWSMDKGKAREVKLTVYDILGREVAVLVNEEKLPGTYEAVFNGGNLSSGVYFYKLEAGGYYQTKKLLLLK